MSREGGKWVSRLRLSKKVVGEGSCGGGCQWRWTEIVAGAGRMGQEVTFYAKDLPYVNVSHLIHPQRDFLRNGTCKIKKG